jgi:hypothetical protein
MHDYYARVNIFTLSYSFSLNKLKNQKYHTVRTIPKSNILNDLEQLLEVTQVSKHSIGFK